MNAPMQATPHAELIAALMDSRVPKTEREHAAAHEIERLREQLQTAADNAISQGARMQAEIERLHENNSRLRSLLNIMLTACDQAAVQAKRIREALGV